MTSRPKRRCRLVFTDERFVFAKRSYPDVPLLVDANNRFVEPVCDYLRARVVYGRLSPSSARTYAESILHFWNFLSAKPLSYLEVNDGTLLEWLNEQSDLSDTTRGARCDAVFDLYTWLESEGYVHRVVRIPGFNDHEPFRPQLTARPAKASSFRRGVSVHGLVSALRPKQQASLPLPTPDTVEIGRLHAAVDGAANADVVDRNHLLLDWYRQVGVRRMEWQALTTAQIPSWASIDAAAARMEGIEIPLTKTKGGRPRYAGVLPELLERTREYIEGPRKQLVDRFRAKLGAAYREPAEVFLSNKTGGPLEPKAISNLLKTLFEQAEVAGHGHRLRASYLTRLFEAELAMEEARVATNPGAKLHVDFELILRRVAERAGHRHIDSLRPYLTLARKRLARNPHAERLRTIEQMLDAKRTELAHTTALLDEQRSRLAGAGSGASRKQSEGAKSP